MSDYQLHVPASATTSEQLAQLVGELGSSIARAVGGAAQVQPQKADADEDNFSQEIVVSTEKGKLEVMVLWSKDDGKTDVSVGASATVKGIVGYLPLLLALAVGFAADKTPELLPVLRGIRVALGATVGLVAGFLLLAVVGFLGAASKAKVKTGVEEQVEGAVRDVMLARGASASS
jgi:hypothetical protein